MIFEDVADTMETQETLPRSGLPVAEEEEESGAMWSREGLDKDTKFSPRRRRKSAGQNVISSSSVVLCLVLCAILVLCCCVEVSEANRR